jgi:hypothetical protein
MGRSDHPDLPPDVEVRAYLKGDEEAIVPFLENIMGWPATSTTVDHFEHWRWKFLANPLGFHLVCVALFDGRVVSHSASMPVRVKVGDRTVIASQGVDLCTDPSFRGGGLIGRTMACRNRMKDEHNVELDFGFPNEASYHISITKQGFTDLKIVMLQHRYIISYEPFNFKGLPHEAPLTLGYGAKVDAFRRKYREYMWDAEYRERRGAAVTAGGRSFTDYTVFRQPSGKRAVVVANMDADKAIRVVVAMDGGANGELVTATPEKPAKRKSSGRFTVHPRSVIVLMEV